MRDRRPSFSILGVIAACAALVCAGLPMTATAVMAGLAPDSPQARIDPNDRRSPWAAVGAVRIGEQTFTGVLIRPRFVLTAAHMIVGHPPESIRFQLNLDRRQPTINDIERVIVHPDYRGGAGPESPNDLALLELAGDAPSGLAIPPPYYGSLAPGTEFRFVGYGRSGSGDQGPTVDSRPDVKRVGANTADRFIPSPSAASMPAMFLYDFDAARRPNAMGRKGLANELESAVAPGDSGAPVFITRGGRWELIGVMTFSTAVRQRGIAVGTFGSVGGGVLLGPSRDWIETTTSHALARVDARPANDSP
ncbi:MAG: trypsin-like serine protease [Burkholderiaceae bacterium]